MKIGHSEVHIRWVSRVMSWATYGAMLLFLVTILVGISRPHTQITMVFVLLLFTLGPILILAGFGIGLYAVLRIRCPECGDRFYSVITPTFPVSWPLQNHCVSCGHSVDVF